MKKIYNKLKKVLFNTKSSDWAALDVVFIHITNFFFLEKITRIESEKLRKLYLQKKYYKLPVDFFERNFRWFFLKNTSKLKKQNNNELKTN